jgi:hypothetical protein
MYWFDLKMFFPTVSAKPSYRIPLGWTYHKLGETLSHMSELVSAEQVAVKRRCVV